MYGMTFTLLIQFILEVFAWVSVGYWGWTQHDGALKILLGPVAVIAVAFIWGRFRVPNDPGKAPVVIPAKRRLGLEMAVFALGIFSLYAGGAPIAALLLLIYMLAFYSLAGRFLFLLRHP